jgi:hypothetical protein
LLSVQGSSSFWGRRCARLACRREKYCHDGGMALARHHGGASRGGCRPKGSAIAIVATRRGSPLQSCGGDLIVGSNNGGRKSTPSDPFRPLQKRRFAGETPQGAGIELLWGRRSRPPRFFRRRKKYCHNGGMVFASPSGVGLPGVQDGDDGPFPRFLKHLLCRGKSVEVLDSRPLGSGMDSSAFERALLPVPR